MKLVLLRCALVASVCAITGCASTEPVQAWQKGHLAKPDMTFDSNAVDEKFVQHVYTSKEAASGGYSVGGGGCGCN